MTGPTHSRPGATQHSPLGATPGEDGEEEDVDFGRVARLADGVVLLGEYEGGGYREPRYLIARGDGQMVMVSQMLHVIASALDGQRMLGEVAEHVSAEYGSPLSPAAVQYLIDNKLAKLGLAAFNDSAVSMPRANPLLSLTLRGVLLPARVVRVIAKVFAPLFLPPVVVIVLLTLLTLDGWLLLTGRIDTALRYSFGSPGIILIAIGAIFGGTLFHEFGHAAGCHYGGGRPGKIGFGVLIFFPCFYTNVTDAYRLNRRGRLRTDLGGIYFNSIFIVALGALYLRTGSAVLPTIIVLTHIQMMEQLMPMIRLDGYYILGDLVGVPNLFALVKPAVRRLFSRRAARPALEHLRPRVRVIVTLWIAIVVPLLVSSLVGLAIRLPVYLRSTLVSAHAYGRAIAAGWQHGHIALVAFAAVSMLLLAVPWLGTGALLTRTIAKIVIRIAKVRHLRAASGQHSQSRQRAMSTAQRG